MSLCSTGFKWQGSSIGLSDGFVASDNKQLHEPMMTRVSDAMCYH